MGSFAMLSCCNDGTSLRQYSIFNTGKLRFIVTHCWYFLYKILQQLGSYFSVSVAMYYMYTEILQGNILPLQRYVPLLQHFYGQKVLQDIIYISLVGMKAKKNIMWVPVLITGVQMTKSFPLGLKNKWFAVGVTTTSNFWSSLSRHCSFLSSDPNFHL